MVLGCREAIWLIRVLLLGSTSPSLSCEQSHGGKKGMSLKCTVVDRSLQTRSSLKVKNAKESDKAILEDQVALG